MSFTLSTGRNKNALLTPRCYFILNRQANFFHPGLIKEGFPVIQPVLLVDEDPRDDTPLVETPVFVAPIPARVVTTAKLFFDSALPDLVYGMMNGDIVLFANQGVNATTGEFLGFEFRQVLKAGYEGACMIRDLQVATLDTCHLSIVAAAICHRPQWPQGNFMYTTQLCDTVVPDRSDDKVQPRLGGGGGDPHIKRWDQERFSFHGECDMVMVHTGTFHNGTGIDIHARSTMESYYSYFESFAVRIGATTLEFYRDQFYVNGVERRDLPYTFEHHGYQYSVTVSPETTTKSASTHTTTYMIDLHTESQIKIRFYKKFGNMDIIGHPNDFQDSVGLLGNFTTGAMHSRAGEIMTTTTTDEFGFEWQVQPHVDPTLFRHVRAPQLPYERCRMPTAARPSRRHLRRTPQQVAAETACRHVHGLDFDLCVHDVVATGDVGLAEFW